MRLGRLSLAVAVVAGLYFSRAEAQTVRSDGVPALQNLSEVEGVGVRDLPFSLVEKMTKTQILGDGTTVTNVSEHRVIRDSEGRVRTETGRVENGEFKVEIAQWNDSAIRTNILLNYKNLTARVMHFGEARARTAETRTPEQIAAMRERAATARAERLTHAERTSVEKLSSQTIDGFFTEGTRMTRVIPEGSEGNDREITVVRETWFSPELKIVMARTLDDPRKGKSSMEVSELQRTEPEPALFQIPANFQLVERDSEAVLPE